MNPFETLGLEPRLAISEEELRSAFRETGKRDHPDAGGSGEDFARIQDAFARLSSPSKRLRAWLEIKGIAGDERGSISPGLIDLFGKIGTVLQQADELIKRRESALSALAKAMLEPTVQQVREALESSLEEVAAAIETEVTGFSGIEANPADPWVTARDLAFLEKWQAELKSRFAGLW